MFNSGFPTTNFSLKDTSGAQTGALLSAPADGLNVPFFFLMAERGVPGEIYYGAAAELTRFLGSDTFEPTAPYYNPATLFASSAMTGQGVNVMRLVDPAAKAATFGLFLTVTEKAVIQYQRNSDGSLKVNGSGDPLPKLAVDNVTIVTEPGVVLKWTSRKLADNEDFTSLPIVTATVGGNPTKTYPILAGKLLQGKYGNRQGFSLYSSPVRGSVAAQAIGSTLYRFIPMELPTAVSTTASPIADLFGGQFNDISFKKSAVYGGTSYNYAFNSVLKNNYVDQPSGNSTLPYNVQVYGNNIGLIGTAALAVSPELGTIDPYLLDLVTATDLDGHVFNHIQLDPTSTTVVNASVVNYASGGTDGDTSWAKFETLVSDWLSGSNHGEFGNLQQHPMTHFSDPGFSMTVKPLLLNMLDLRDNIKIDLSTQDVALRANTKAEDIAAGQTLLFRAQMHPESIINGVACARVGIYAHAGYLAASGGYEGLVPYTYNRLVKRRDLDGGSYIKGSAGGRPGSEVTLFRKSNWVADDKPSQALAWASCINVVRHATRTVVFYPSLRTVYTNDTSLLSDDEISDRIVYLHKICREIWANYTGSRLPKPTLYTRIQNDINQRCAAAFSNDNFNVVSTVGQTATDANLGSQVSVNLAVTGNNALRIMNFDVVVGRALAE